MPAMFLSGLAGAVKADGIDDGSGGEDEGGGAHLLEEVGAGEEDEEEAGEGEQDRQRVEGHTEALNLVAGICWIGVGLIAGAAVSGEEDGDAL